MGFEVFWSAAIRDLLEGNCVYRAVCDGGLWAFAHHVHDALFDYDMYGRAAVLEDEICDQTVGFVGHVYKLCWSEAMPKRHHGASLRPPNSLPMSAAYRSARLHMGSKCWASISVIQLGGREFSLSSIASADEIRFYPFPEEEADEDEDVGRKSIHAAPRRRPRKTWTGSGGTGEHRGGRWPHRELPARRANRWPARRLPNEGT